MYNYLHYLVGRCRNRYTIVMYFLKINNDYSGCKLKRYFSTRKSRERLHLATNPSHHSNMFNVCNLYLFQFMVKLLGMCSASEANKELIRHDVMVLDKQTYVRDLISTLETVDQFSFLYWQASYLKHKEAFVLAMCRFCSHFTETDFVV